MELTPDSPLRQTGLDYLSEQYFATINKPLPPEQVILSVDALESTLTISSRDYTTDNEVGLYQGSHTVSYEKANLSALLPHPLEVMLSYPARWNDIRDYLVNRYSIVVEDSEFALEIDGDPIVGDTLISETPDLAGDVLYLYALPTAVRWVAGSYMMLRIVRIGQAQSITSTVAQSTPGNATTLLDFPV